MSRRLIRTLSIVAGFITGLLFMNKWEACHREKQPQTKETVITKTVYDSAVRYIPSSPKYITLRDSVAYVISANECVDTAAIIKQYFTAYYQQQTLRDSLLEAVIEDTLFQNHVTWRSFSYKILRPESITEKKTIAEKHIQVYFGAELGIDKSSIGLSPELILTDKQNRAYSLRTNLFIPQPNIAIGTYFKICK